MWLPTGTILIIMKAVLMFVRVRRCARGVMGRKRRNLSGMKAQPLRFLTLKRFQGVNYRSVDSYFPNRLIPSAKRSILTFKYITKLFWIVFASIKTCVWYQHKIKFTSVDFHTAVFTLRRTALAAMSRDLAGSSVAGR